jgi:hypothetical protein
MSSKLTRQHNQLSMKFEYHAKLMTVADQQLTENPDPIEVDLYERLVDDYYAAKQALNVFETRTQRLQKLNQINTLKQ